MRMIEINSQEIRYFYRNIVKSGEVFRIKYNNKVSDMGYIISKEISNLLTNGLDSTISFLGQLFNG